ncbi:MAG: hypothetical protein IJ193_06770 [Bacilli bacterium]|nr:hypothetical protein [Bacilli bacterium]
MIYKVGMFCKHFKGENLFEKNIYRIEKLHVSGDRIDENFITYSGDGRLADAEDLVVYSNVFQNGKLFAREYQDLSSPLEESKQMIYHQELRVQPLTDEELQTIRSKEFIEKKQSITDEKYKTLSK